MASAANLLFAVAVLVLVQSIEAWVPSFFQGFNTGYNPEYIPGFNPGYNPYIPSLPFVPGFPGFSGAPPSYYDVNHVMGHSSPGSSSDNSVRRPHLQESRFFGSPFSGALSPLNWLFRKWPISWNVPPATTEYYNTGNGNGWSKLKTWSWSF